MSWLDQPAGTHEVYVTDRPRYPDNEFERHINALENAIFAYRKSQKLNNRFLMGEWKDSIKFWCGEIRRSRV